MTRSSEGGLCLAGQSPNEKVLTDVGVTGAGGVSQVSKFEQVYSCYMGTALWTDRQTDTTENITFLEIVLTGRDYIL